MARRGRGDSEVVPGHALGRGGAPVSATAVAAAAVAGRAAVAPLVGRRARRHRARDGGAPGHALGRGGVPVGASAAASAAVIERAAVEPATFLAVAVSLWVPTPW